MTDFEEFFEREHARVVRSLALASGGWEGAEDAAQVAFAKAFRRWRSVSCMDRPATWVYVVAVRELRGRRWRDARPVATGEAVWDRLSADAVDRIWVVELLSGLTDRQRLAVVLRYLCDLSIEETARAMRCAPGTVKATVHAALGRMRLIADAEGTADAH